ncbi:hypothetical protein G7Y89_g10490 [Cudoniella acicularis]|uniref:Uncharacterized protein n=1 Tax=Cudoniella acicularis TaxID=354080 RepID=A0A8H4RCM5_9HELO|nr:hypothetical protein G7Y89_g10490 [Cudoniella acicularis]
MVSLKTVRQSNAALQAFPPGIVAVFAGATQGIGLATLKQFAKYVSGPKAYIIGRSHEKGKHIIDQLKILNPMGSFMFIEAQISKFAEVDRVCEEIKSLENHVDILCMSMGYLSLGGRVETPEGIETNRALQLYSRLRLTMNLLPHLERSMSPRIVSVLSAGFEGPLDLSDLDWKSHKSYSVFKAAAPASTMMNLFFEELAKDHPTVSFVHSFPGVVATNNVDNMFAHAPGLLWFPAQIPRYTVVPLLNMFAAISPDEAGERTLFLATNARYPPAEDHIEARKMGGFVDRPQGVPFAASTIMKEGRGNGVYRVNSHGETCKDSALLKGYRKDDIGKVVWEHTMRVFAEALANRDENGNGNENGLREAEANVSDTDSLDFELDLKS